MKDTAIYKKLDKADQRYRSLLKRATLFDLLRNAAFYGIVYVVIVGVFDVLTRTERSVIEYFMGVVLFATSMFLLELFLSRYYQKKTPTKQTRNAKSK